MKPWILLALAGAAHAAADADLARCRAIADGAARLACYDALVAGPAAASAAAPAAQQPPAAAAPPGPEFGFESRLPPGTPDAIESRVRGRFDGWEPGMKIRLENGQVWQVIDGSRGVMSVHDVKVRVTRASMGTFFLEFEGRRSAPRVRRVE